MTPCGQNYVTPTMIKKGQITIGDRIQFEEDILVGGPAAEETPAPEVVEAAAHQSAGWGETMTGADRQNDPAGWGGTMTGADRQNDPAGWGRTAAEQQFRAASPSPGGADFNRPYPTQNNMNASRPIDIASIPLVFEQMTNYAESISGSSGSSPVFGIPDHPMVPPEYEQSIDYDSIQYMNGFLRTQIGRGMLVQQLIGSGNTVDRYGFLVGIGNNYLLLQDFSDGNIMLIDFYTVKYVYIYYSQPVFPPQIR